jgi:hypothetical protein
MTKSWMDARIDEARDMCVEAGLTNDETDGVQAWLLGALLSHFDPGTMGSIGSLSIPNPLTEARWREYVRRAIADRP